MRVKMIFEESHCIFYMEMRIRMNDKIAILFPGIGYHTDKPLLYFSKDLAAGLNYEYREVFYGEMPKAVKGDAGKKQEAFALARKQVKRQLDEMDFSQYETIIFISKSLGSILAADYADSHKLDVRHIIFTPIQETLTLSIKKGIVFHGTKDNWINTEDLKKKCAKEGLRLYLIENADHSLETENTLTNIENIRIIMGQVKDYLSI